MTSTEKLILQNQEVILRALEQLLDVTPTINWIKKRNCCQEQALQTKSFIAQKKFIKGN